MEIDVSDTEAAEVVEGLKRAPAIDAPDDEGPSAPAGEATEETPPTEEGDRLDDAADAVSTEELDEAVGRLWGAAFGAAAAYLDEPELQESREDVQRAADALGPLARKHVPKHLQSMGPEAIALVFVAERLSSKSEHLT
jgi:hypothetical protein